MWCTRWFLPLLLLPLPTASPYFLFLFFFSLTLHARPCFYCIILLTALFTSSCYWQPVPTRALLKASFPNVSLEGALWYQPNASLSDDSTISSSQLLPMPSLTRMLDRCWCDLSGGHLFDPYNITLWQLSSLSHTLGAAESQPALIAQEMDTPSDPKNVTETRRLARAWVLKTTEKDARRPEGDNHGAPSANGSFSGWFRPAMPFLWPLRVPMPFLFNFGRRNSSDSPSADSLPPEPNVDGADDAKTRHLRRRYDLREHGIDLVVDFGWGRSYD